MVAEFLKICLSKLSGIVCIRYGGERFSTPIKAFCGVKKEEGPRKS